MSVHMHICIHVSYFLSIHPLMEIGCFYILLTVTNAAMDTRVQISLRDPDFSSFGKTSRNRIGGSYGNYIFTFLRHLLCFP